MGYIDLEQKETYKKLKMEVDIVGDTGILIKLLLVMIKKKWYYAVGTVTATVNR